MNDNNKTLKNNKTFKISEGMTVSDIFNLVKTRIPPSHHKIFLEKLIYNKVDTRLDQNCLTRIQEIIKFITDNNIDAIFVSEKSFFNQLCLAKRLKDVGKNSISISLDGAQPHLENSYFLASYELTLIEFIYLISLTSSLIFSQGWLFRYHQLVFIDILKGKNTHYVDFMDLNTFLFDEVPEKVITLIKKVWGEDAVENNLLQKWCEKELCRTAEKCFFPGSESHVSALGLDRSEIKKSLLVNFSINSDMFVTKTQRNEGATKFVYAGGIPPFDERRVPEFFSDAQLIKTFTPLLKRNKNLQIDVYNNPLIMSESEYEAVYKPHFQLEKKYKGYGFYHGSDGLSIRQTLSGYCFGLMLFNFRETLFGKEHFNNLIPTKFYLYLEAGLPVIVSSEWRELSILIEKYNAGLSVTWYPELNLENLVKNIDKVTMSKNVLKLRDDLAKRSYIGLT